MEKDNILKRAEESANRFDKSIMNFLDEMMAFVTRVPLEKERINKIQEEKYTKNLKSLFAELETFNKQNLIDKYLDEGNFEKLKQILVI